MHAYLELYKTVETNSKLLCKKKVSLDIEKGKKIHKEYID